MSKIKTLKQITDSVLSKKRKELEREEKNFTRQIESLKKNVERGVIFLDKKLGRKLWLSKIKEEKLDMASTKTCICGQAFGSFWNVVYGYASPETNEVLLSTKQSYLKGFQADDNQYDLLATLWVEKIKELRNLK